MFGGLELKGAGDDDKAGDAAPAAPTSAFGFLNAAAPVASADAPPPGSGFSFLNAGAAAPVATPEPASEPTPAASSGFSFLQGSIVSSATAPAPEVVAPIETSSTGMAESSSGFSFLIPSPDKAPHHQSLSTPTSTSVPVNSDEPAADDDAPPPKSSPTVTTTTTSAFGFLSAANSTDSADNYNNSHQPPAASPQPSAIPTVSVGSASVASSIVSAPSPVPIAAPPNVLEFPSSSHQASSGLPTGAGITFGTASTTKPRKKKTRTQRVGLGMGAAATAAMPPPAPVPAPAPVLPAAAPVAAPATGTESAASSPNRETRDAAVEAQRRAEEFMHRKTIAEANQPAPTPTPPPATATTAHSSTQQYDVPTYDDPPPLRPTASNDEEVARARRAAEEAQKMTIPKEGRGGFMGTFFKGFGSNSSLGSGGASGGKNNNSSGHRRPSPVPSAATMAAVDKVTQQQQEMKRAAAERQMQLQQQRQKSDDDEDDDAVVVSTSVSGYHHPEPPTVVEAPAPPTATRGLSMMSKFEPIQPSKPSSNKIVVRELAPTPKRKKTPTQAFEEYQALFAQSVHRTIQQVEAVRSQQRMLSEERFVSFAKERLATQQIQQTEAQLQVAVDHEDYELADQLGQVIEAHKREKAEVASFLDSIAKGLVQLESQKALVVQGVATCFDNLAVHIKELQEQETYKERDSDSETLKQFATISKQLSAEQERLQQDLKHLERDESLVSEERSELEVAISEQSGEYEKQRDDVKGKLSTIEEEIAELRRQLEIKSKIAAGLRTEMHGLEDNISKVRVKFSRQRTRVDKKERTIQENRLEWETESAMFKRQKEAHELQVQSHSEALLAHDALMKTLDCELKLCKEFAGMVSTKLGFMQKDGKSKEAEDAEAESNLAQLQADVVKCEAACSEAKVILKAATATVANLEAEHSMLITRVPQLEAEKKSHAAKRDFKAASKASKGIKDATARLKECEQELVGEAANKKTAAEEELAKATAELERTRKIAEEEEKVAGIARMHDLAKQIKQLVATKEEMCGDTSSNQNTVKAVGAFVLEGQIKALKDEGQNLGTQYSGWNDLIKDILGEEGQIEDVPKPEENEAASSSSPAPATAVADDGLTSEERVAKVRDLVQRLQAAEEALEAAADREDFDEAARLQDVFEKLQSELENVNLTDEESELAFADEEPPPTVPAAPSTDSAEAPAEDENDEQEQQDLQNDGGDDKATEEVAEEAAVVEDAPTIEQAAPEKVQPDDFKDEENSNDKDDDDDDSPSGESESPEVAADAEETEEDETPGENGATEKEEQVDEEKETKESESEEIPLSASDNDDLAAAKGEDAAQETA